MKKNKGATDAPSPGPDRAVKGEKGVCISVKKGEPLILDSPGSSFKKPAKKEEDR